MNTFTNEETRLRDPQTGAEKGSKEARFDLIPAGPLETLARVFGRGAKKYAERNWERGYPWGWSFAALMRHAWAFWRGENIDPESGLPHLAHAAWHCFVLQEFAVRHPGKDDRSNPNWESARKYREQDFGELRGVMNATAAPANKRPSESERLLREAVGLRSRVRELTAENSLLKTAREDLLAMIRGYVSRLARLRERVGVLRHRLNELTGMNVPATPGPVTDAERLAHKKENEEIYAEAVYWRDSLSAAQKTISLRDETIVSLHKEVAVLRGHLSPKADSSVSNDL